LCKILKGFLVGGLVQLNAFRLHDSEALDREIIECCRRILNDGYFYEQKCLQ
jgi:hypothetical protein